MSVQVERIISPQDGYQKQFTSCPADIVIGGSGAGVGKSFALLLDSARGIFRHSKYGATIFRNSYPEITMQGGLWDESTNIFPSMGGVPNESKHRWIFPETKSRIEFKFLADDRELENWGGSQIPYIGFDELTKFTKKMFIWMLVRNRVGSMEPLQGGVMMRPKIRATCNPDPDSWVAEFISWYIDQETGFPIPERAGKIIYFTVDQDNFVFGLTRQEVIDKCPHIFDLPENKGLSPRDLVKSLAFIPGSIYDNKELLKRNPGYLANLRAQSEEDQLRLLMGNWKVRADGASLFDWSALENMFSNVVPESFQDKYYITIDHAREGQDLCTIFTWKGWKVVRIDILTKADTNAILKIVQMLRFKYIPLPVSQIIVDQDGIGVKDMLRCHLFQGGATETVVRMPGPQGNKAIKLMFQNKKTQCYYKLSEKINGNLIHISLDNVWCDGVHVTNGLIKQQGKLYEIRKRIKDDLRVVKKENPDHEGRKKVTDKKQQKNANGGLSPDFGDGINLRAEFEFIKQPVYMK